MVTCRHFDALKTEAEARRGSYLWGDEDDARSKKKKFVALYEKLHR